MTGRPGGRIKLKNSEVLYMIELDKELINESLNNKSVYFFSYNSLYLLKENKKAALGYSLKLIAKRINPGGLPWTGKGRFYSVAKELASEWLKQWADAGKLAVVSKEAYI